MVESNFFLYFDDAATNSNNKYLCLTIINYKYDYISIRRK
uniref:Uncharacterized protein n=1 Tax=Anguilla anguilla TaxID=7936 RepID=A0A0E9UQD0_ANGAN